MPPLEVRQSLNERGYQLGKWISKGDPDDPTWLNYCSSKTGDRRFLVTAAKVTGKWIVEVLARHELIEVVVKEK